MVHEYEWNESEVFPGTTRRYWVCVPAQYRGEMPVTIGVFVDPGEPDNRNAEYDAFDDAYATFLLARSCRTSKRATA